jgi:hypothetical protein
VVTEAGAGCTPGACDSPVRNTPKQKQKSGEEEYACVTKKIVDSNDPYRSGEPNHVAGKAGITWESGLIFELLG